MKKQKKFLIDYMVNHELETMQIEADSREEAILKADNKLKEMKISFVIYGAR